jgi:hypothetical protein
MKTLAQEELESIEYQKRTWKSKVFREMEIWQEIAMQLNSTEGEEHKHWILVMDLYNEKYRK